MTESDPLPADLRAVIAREAETLDRLYSRIPPGSRVADCTDAMERIARLAWEARGHTEDDPDDISSSETPVHAWTDEQLTEMRRIARAHDLRHARRSLEAAGYTILPPSADERRARAGAEPMTRQPLAPEIDAAIREKAANIATLRFGPIHLLREGIERTSAESYRSALVEHMREIAALAVAHTQQAEREALTTQVEQWRRDAARHKTHSDCYHVGQGWGLEQCADELTALLLPAPDGSQEG